MMKDPKAEPKPPRPRRRAALGLAAVCLAVFFAGLFFSGPIRRHRARENGYKAMAELKKLMDAQSIYRESDRDRNGVFEYGSLTFLHKAGLIDEELGTGVKHGYRFVVVPGTDGTRNNQYLYWIAADPLVPGVTGDRYLFANQGGIGYSSHDAPIRPKPGSGNNENSHGHHLHLHR